jgi:hypothetical protein
MQLEAKILFSSILTGNLEIVHEVLSNQQVIALLQQESQNGKGQTALQMAVFYKQWKIASKLLQHLSRRELMKQDTVKLIGTIQNEHLDQEDEDDEQEIGALFHTTTGKEKVHALEVHFEIALKLTSNNNIFGEPVSYEPASPNGPVFFRNLNRRIPDSAPVSPTSLATPASLLTVAYTPPSSRALPVLVSLTAEDLSAAKILAQLKAN